MKEFCCESNLNEMFGRKTALRREGQTDEAIAILREALHIYPEHPSILSELTLTLTNRYTDSHQSCDFSEAIVLSERVLAGSASNSERVILLREAAALALTVLCDKIERKGAQQEIDPEASMHARMWQLRLHELRILFGTVSKSIGEE